MVLYLELILYNFKLKRELDMMKYYIKELFQHYRSVWKFDKYDIYKLETGPMKKFCEDFSILVIPPTEDRNMWIYATLGMSINNRNGFELHIFSNSKNNRLIDILTSISYYQMKEGILDLNSTVNFGTAWASNSKCEYGLISLPYLDGPSLENFKLEIKCYWLIPITLSERNYRWEKGIDKLEQLFEDNNLNYLDKYRKSII